LLAILNAPAWTYIAAAPFVCLFVIASLLAADPEWPRKRDTWLAGRSRATNH
jgi:hypothetical protein